MADILYTVISRDGPLIVGAANLVDALGKPHSLLNRAILLSELPPDADPKLGDTITGHPDGSFTL